MSTPYLPDNEGVGGGPFLTLSVDSTAAKDFSQDDLDNGLSACVIAGNNEAGMGRTVAKKRREVVDLSDWLRSCGLGEMWPTGFCRRKDSDERTSAE